MPRAPRATFQPVQAPGFNAPGVQARPQNAIPGQLVQQGEALQRFGEAAADAAQQMRLEQAETSAREKDNLFSETLRNQYAELSRLSGRDAVLAFDKVETNARKALADLLDKTEDPTEKKMLGLAAEQRIQRHMALAQGHREQEFASWRKGTLDAARKGAQLDFHKEVMTGGDGEVPRATAIQRAREQSDLLGEGEEQRRIRLLETTTAMHGEVVDDLIGQGKGMQALAHLQDYEDEIAPSFAADRAARAKQAMLGEIATKIDQDGASAADRFSKVDAMVKSGVMGDQDADVIRRHLFHKEDQRDRVAAEVAQDVERRALAIRAANPGLRIEDVDPALARDVQRFGIKLQRVTDDRFMADFENATPEQFRKWRSMTDSQLHREFAPFTDAHDEGRIMKIIRGNDQGAKIDDQIKLLAQNVGLLAKTSNADGRYEESQKFLNWKVNTIGPMMQALADELKRPLTALDVQERIVNPIMQDQVWRKADWMAADAQMPLMRAQVNAVAPVDDPNTPNVDEGADFSKYQDLYVEVEGQRVMLRDIPLEVRESIRKTWRDDPKTRGRWLTVEREAREWINLGRPGLAKPGSVGAVPQAGSPIVPGREQRGVPPMGPK